MSGLTNAPESDHISSCKPVFFVSANIGKQNENCQKIAKVFKNDCELLSGNNVVSDINSLREREIDIEQPGDVDNISRLSLWVFKGDRQLEKKIKMLFNYDSTAYTFLAKVANQNSGMIKERKDIPDDHKRFVSKKLMTVTGNLLEIDDKLSNQVKTGTNVRREYLEANQSYKDAKAGLKKLQKDLLDASEELQKNEKRFKDMLEYAGGDDEEIEEINSLKNITTEGLNAKIEELREKIKDAEINVNNCGDKFNASEKAFLEIKNQLEGTVAKYAQLQENARELTEELNEIEKNTRNQYVQDLIKLTSAQVNNVLESPTRASLEDLLTIIKKTEKILGQDVIALENKSTESQQNVVYKSKELVRRTNAHNKALSNIDTQKVLINNIKAQIAEDENRLKNAQNEEETLELNWDTYTTANKFSNEDNRLPKAIKFREMINLKKEEIRIVKQQLNQQLTTEKNELDSMLSVLISLEAIADRKAMKVIFARDEYEQAVNEQQRLEQELNQAVQVYEEFHAFASQATTLIHMMINENEQAKEQENEGGLEDNKQVRGTIKSKEGELEEVARPKNERDIKAELTEAAQALCYLERSLDAVADKRKAFNKKQFEYIALLHLVKARQRQNLDILHAEIEQLEKLQKELFSPLPL